MPTNRRNFLAGAGLATGVGASVGALPLNAASASPRPWPNPILAR